MTSCTVFKRISHIWLISSFVYPFFFLANKLFHHISSASMSASVFKFRIHDEENQMYNYEQNQGAEIYFCLLFLFFPFSISHFKVMDMEIFVKYFSGTTLPRSLKLGTYIRYDRSYCVLKNQSHMAYQSHYLFIFLSFQQLFHLNSSASMSATFFKFCIHNEYIKVYYCKQSQGAEIYFCLLKFSIFSFYFLSRHCNEYGNFRQRFLRNYLT